LFSYAFISPDVYLAVESLLPASNKTHHTNTLFGQKRKIKSWRREEAKGKKNRGVEGEEEKKRGNDDKESLMIMMPNENQTKPFLI